MPRPLGRGGVPKSGLGAFLMPQPRWGTEINTHEQGEKGIVFRSLRIYPPKC
jgi:hypothetical protein